MGRLEGVTDALAWGAGAGRWPHNHPDRRPAPNIPVHVDTRMHTCAALPPGGGAACPRGLRGPEETRTPATPGPATSWAGATRLPCYGWESQVRACPCLYRQGDAEQEGDPRGRRPGTPPSLGVRGQAATAVALCVGMPRVSRRVWGGEASPSGDRERPRPADVCPANWGTLLCAPAQPHSPLLDRNVVLAVPRFGGHHRYLGWGFSGQLPQFPVDLAFLSKAAGAPQT